MKHTQLYSWRRSYKLKFHGTDTDTDTDFLARKSACPAHAEVGAACRGARRTRTNDLSADFCLTRAFRRYRGSPLGMRACTRVRVLSHDKLSCTHLQNYTIGASLMSLSVSVPWNLSYTRSRSREQTGNTTLLFVQCVTQDSKPTQHPDNINQPSRGETICSRRRQ